jgi:hypothetical protein
MAQYNHDQHHQTIHRIACRFAEHTMMFACFVGARMDWMADGMITIVGCCWFKRSILQHSKQSTNSMSFAQYKACMAQMYDILGGVDVRSLFDAEDPCAARG